MAWKLSDVWTVGFMVVGAFCMSYHFAVVKTRPLERSIASEPSSRLAFDASFKF